MPATERDTSFGDPPSRDPQRTRVLNVLHDAPDHARVRVQQDHPYGMDVFEFEFVKVLERWRIADRVQVFDDGERVAGLL